MNERVPFLSHSFILDSIDNNKQKKAVATNSYLIDYMSPVDETTTIGKAIHIVGDFKLQAR